MSVSHLPEAFPPVPVLTDSPASPPSANASSPEDGALPPCNPRLAKRAGFWRVFVSTFGAIFLAELGDKTQLATLLMSAESGQPWVVFAGAGTALVLTSLIGVAVGQWLSRRVSPHTLDTAAGTALLGITVWLLWDVVHL